MPSLFVGIDVAKTSHVAAFVSASLLERQKRLTMCPTLKFGADRAGLNDLLKSIRCHAPFSETAILMEQTGHYHHTLMEALLAEGLQVYVIAVHERKSGRDKTDKADALRLAGLLHSHLQLGLVQENEISQRLPPIAAAANLAPLVRLHYELTQQRTRAKNKLTALADEIFPEMAQVFQDVNGVTALDLREQFPTPASIATAPEFEPIRHGTYPNARQMRQMQELATTSIGTKNEARLHGLLLEQKQLIQLFRLISDQLKEVDQEIKEILETSREGQILLSVPAIGQQHAAVLLASIGNIRNFDKASRLRRFVGWSPQSFQTGVSVDRDTQTRTGSRLIKQEMYLVCLQAVKEEPWRSFYLRLVAKKCAYDARLKRPRGRMKVIGRLAGTIITVIFALLASDASLVDSTPGVEPAPPQLYDAALHLAHRSGKRIHSVLS